MYKETMLMLKMDAYTRLVRLLMPDDCPLVVIDRRVWAIVEELGYGAEFQDFLDAAPRREDGGETAAAIRSLLELVRDDRDHDDRENPGYEEPGAIWPNVDGYKPFDDPHHRVYSHLFD
jgi:hypothetical protein